MQSDENSHWKLKLGRSWGSTIIWCFNCRM